MDRHPLLSIIITSYTTERLHDIDELLDSIKGQTYPNIETIFVAERSMELLDKVKEYVQKENILDVLVIFNNGKLGASCARNLGIKEAKGDILAFVDDDVILFSDWAKEMVKTYEDPSIVGVTGPIFPLWEDKSMSWFPEELDWVISCDRWRGLIRKTKIRSVSGANASFRRKAFDLVGYSTVLGPKRAERTEWNEFGEETELSIRIRRKTGKCIVFNPQVRVYHKVTKRKLRWGFVAQRAYQVGHTRVMLRKFYASDDKEIDSLTTERELLKRILGRFFPQIQRMFFSNPVVAWRKFLFTAVSLFFLALGYISYPHIPHKGT